MSSMSHAFEERLCRVCDGYDHPRVMFYYAFGRYAHAPCMVEKWGLKAALEKLHDWERPLFKKALKEQVTKGKPHPLVAAVEAFEKAEQAKRKRAKAAKA